MLCGAATKQRFQDVAQIELLVMRHSEYDSGHDDGHDDHENHRCNQQRSARYECHFGVLFGCGDGHSGEVGRWNPFFGLTVKV